MLFSASHFCILKNEGEKGMKKIFLDIAIILIFTKVGSSLSKKFNLPQVLGALVAGVIIGPSVLGFVHESEQISLMSELGVIMLMFLAGLETNLEELKKAGKSSFVIAVGGIIVPLILGTVPTYYITNNFWESLFVGVILTATSVSISVETLKEMGKLNTRAGMNILGAAVIDDILGLILISFVLVLAQASQGGADANISLTLFKVTMKATIFCAASAAAVVFLPRYINKYTEKQGKNEKIAVFAIAGALICGFLAEELGIAAITGAYVCGLTLSSVANKEFIEKKVNSISALFLTPIFFASVGLATDIRGINLNILLLALFMLVVAVCGKIIGCGGAARMLGMDRDESFQIAVGMVSRGEVALITTNLGLQSGIISAQLFIPTLIVVVVTTLITPILLKYAFAVNKEESKEIKVG